MKKLIKKNPIKAQKISLVLFVLLMALSGFLGVLADSLLLWFITVTIAVVQVVNVTKYAQYCIQLEQADKIEQAEKILKDMLGGEKNENKE